MAVKRAKEHFVKKYGREPLGIFANPKTLAAHADLEGVAPKEFVPAGLIFLELEENLYAAYTLEESDHETHLSRRKNNRGRGRNGRTY